MNAPAPPGNGAAACGSAANPDKLTGERGYHACPYGATRMELLPSGHFHYAEERCAACGRHLRWLPKSETLHARRLNAFKLAKLGTRKGLTSWERRFVHGMAQKRRLTPRQQRMLDQLCATYLERQTT